MKRVKLLAKMAERGAVFLRHGRKHDIYENPRARELTQVPRRPDINEYTAHDILKKMAK
ncbi:MAG: type II toxin-antitoxin system HicA family toxin [Treponematales bacterium]